MHERQRSNTWVSKANLLRPSSDEFKVLASKFHDTYGITLKDQIDILYVESCLVTAGEKAGWNENDDIFSREQTWASRHTPLIKPANWQHKDKDIIGVVYSVQARDLNGNILDFNSNTVPDCEFELYTESAIFRLIHPERASEIEKRAAANELFVSMECWFDDYDYATYAEGKIEKVIARNQSTAFLDSCLRAKGGNGKYEDKKIGRILKGITFGGFGFVDRPANKRSVISDVGSARFEKSDDDQSIVSFLNEFMKSSEDLVMNTSANTVEASRGLEPEKVKSAVKDALAEAAAEQKKLADVQAERDRIVAIEMKNKSLEEEVSKLKEAITQKEAIISDFNNQTSVLDSLVKELSGSTAEAPAEIKAIDAAKDGQAAFNAKISFIKRSAAHLVERAARASELEANLAEAAKIVRENEVKQLFAEVVEAEVLDALIAKAKKLSDSEYESWKDEHELILLSASGAKKAKKEKEKDKDMNGSCATDGFRALLEKKRSDATHLINPPGGSEINSGVSANSLRTPRFKIAGGVAETSEPNLDNAQEEGSLNLAGASLNEGENTNVFKALANLVVKGAEIKEDSPKSGKPNFDPVGD